MSDSDEHGSDRLARNFNELLQELRVAQAGVQILFGFLLSIAFMDRYQTVSTSVKVTHVTTIVFAALAVACLSAPAAWHRLLFRQGKREEILQQGNRFAISGMACLAVAMTGTVLLIAEVVIGGWPTILFGVGAALVFGSLWFALPLAESRRGQVDSRDASHADTAVRDDVRATSSAD